MPELSTEERWADFAVQAAGRGCRAMVSTPFPPTTGALGVTGGVNLYVRSASEWVDQARRRAARFLEQAAVPVMNRYLLESAMARADNLETAMASRAAIEQAKGILMERLRLSPEQAFEALARSSMVTNTKLRDVAERWSAPASSTSAEPGHAGRVPVAEVRPACGSTPRWGTVCARSRAAGSPPGPGSAVEATAAEPPAAGSTP